MRLHASRRKSRATKGVRTMQGLHKKSVRTFSNKSRCFSLIELLITVAIIAILAGMLLPTLNKVRAKASQTTCISNMKQMYFAQNEYMDSYEEWLPAGTIRVDNYVFPDRTLSNSISGPSWLLYLGFIKTPMAAICPESIRISGEIIKTAINNKAWSVVGDHMYAPVIYQYGNDHTGKPFASSGYVRTGQFSNSVVLPHPRRYKQPSLYLQNIDANNKYALSASEPAKFQANSNMLGSLSNPGWSGFSDSNTTTVMPSAVHNNTISVGHATGSVRIISPQSLKEYRLFFYRDLLNLNHKL